MIINPYSFGVAFDPDAQAFITAAGITDNTQKSAINTLVVDMKGYGIWTKMKAIYPFVGGTASTHKWNLKDPRDLDAAFRLVFAGGFTHDSNGVQGNGVNGYGDTKFNPNTGYSVNDNGHISVYSRSNQSAVDSDFGVQSGTYLILSIRRSDQSNNSFFGVNTTNFSIYNSDPNSLGLYIANRIGTSQKAFKNSSIVVSSTNASGTRPNANLFFSGLSFNGNPDGGLYSNKQYAFASIGDGLTDTEAGNFYTAVQAFNTTLARQV
jgi:hypothetical protein